MKWIWKHRPSPAMIVALIALVFAMSGTAIAATALVNGDALIARHTLSGDRLRNHTVTGQQLKALVWHPLTLENGWTVYPARGFGATPAYAMDAEGFVHLRGTLDGAAQTSIVAATLPVGFRPRHGAWMPVGSFDVNLFILSAGAMEVINGTGANDVFVSLEGVQFYPK